MLARQDGLVVAGRAPAPAFFPTPAGPDCPREGFVDRRLLDRLSKFGIKLMK